MLGILNTAERAGHYEQVNNYVLSRHLFAYQFSAGQIGNIVLELGCGNGYGMRLLAGQSTSYTGVDKYLPRNPSLQGGTAIFRSYLPHLKNIGDQSYDTVICFQVIEHIADDVTLMKEIHRVLKPGGRLLLTTPNLKTSLTRNPFHVREYTTTSLQKVVASQFSQYSLKGVYGNETVMEYYAANKASVEKWLKWDILDLQNRLPAALLKIPYSILNNINRYMLLRSHHAASTCISPDDFYADTLNEDCLDFFVTAIRS